MMDNGCGTGDIRAGMGRGAWELGFESLPFWERGLSVRG